MVKGRADGRQTGSIGVIVLLLTRRCRSRCPRIRTRVAASVGQLTVEKAGEVFLRAGADEGVLHLASLKEGNGGNGPHAEIFRIQKGPPGVDEEHIDLPPVASCT